LFTDLFAAEEEVKVFLEVKVFCRSLILRSFFSGDFGAGVGCKRAAKRLAFSLAFGGSCFMQGENFAYFGFLHALLSSLKDFHFIVSAEKINYCT